MSTATWNSQFPKDGVVGLQYALDDDTGVLGTMPGFLSGKVGRKIVVTYTDSTKETISSVSFYDGATLLKTIGVTTGSTTDEFERTA